MLFSDSPEEFKDISDSETLDSALAYGERPVYGLSDVEENLIPATPFPITIYNLSGDKSSGIAGTLYPGGEFVPLPNLSAPQPTRWWDDSCACFISGVTTWNGSNAGGIQLHGAPEGGHLRLYDGTLLGDWPINPPRPEKLVNPEKARLVAEIRRMEEDE